MPRRPREEAEIDLEDLETAAAFLGTAGMLDRKNRATCEAFARKVAEAIRAGHAIAVVGRGAKRMPPEERWHVSIGEAPAASRRAVTAALTAVAGYCGERPDLGHVTYLF